MKFNSKLAGLIPGYANLFCIWVFALLLASPVDAKEQKKWDARAACNQHYKKYEAAIDEVNTKPQVCARDSDCELLFIGSLSNCDLGFAVSKKVMSAAYFKKLERLRRAAKRACSEPDGERVHCAAMPATTAKCVNKVCDAN